MMKTNLVRRIDFSMKNVVELCVHDLTVLLAIRICMKNSTKEDTIRTGLVMSIARLEIVQSIASQAALYCTILFTTEVFMHRHCKLKFGFLHCEEGTKFELGL